MISVAEIGSAMKRVLGKVGDEVARETGFTKRASKLSGSKFAQTTVLGWLNRPMATLEELSQTAASLGVSISAQGLDQRFTPEAAALLKQVLDAALSQVIAADPIAIPLLQRFNGVLVEDSSVISLPDALVEVWKGCGGSDGHHIASLKIEVRFDLLTGSLEGPLAEDGRTNDRGSALQKAPLAVGALRITDLGYFSLDQLVACAEARAYFLVRLYLQTALFDLEGKRLLLSSLLKTSADQIDLPILLGTNDRLPVRLLAVRVPQEVADQRRRKVRQDAREQGETPSQVRLAFADWIILVTNVPKEKLSLAEATVLVRVRWQVELLFKLWKSHGKIDEWRTQNPWRILCEVYAKLTAMVLQHWLLLIGCWAYPNHSLVKAAQTICDYAPMLAAALVGLIDFAVPIEQIRLCLQTGCRINSRRNDPNTYQLLLNLQEAT